MSFFARFKTTVPRRQSLFVSLVYEDTFKSIFRNLPGLVAVTLPWSTIGPFVVAFLNQGKPHPLAMSLFPLLAMVMTSVYLREEGRTTGSRIAATFLLSWTHFFQILFSFMLAAAPVGLLVSGAFFLSKLLKGPGTLLLVLFGISGAVFLLIITPFIVPVLTHEAGKNGNPFKRILRLTAWHRSRILLAQLAPALILGSFIIPLLMPPQGPPQIPSAGSLVLFTLFQLLVTIFSNVMQVFLYYHARAEAGEDYPDSVTGPVPGEKLA